jgi:hypothetical protein
MCAGHRLPHTGFGKIQRARPDLCGLLLPWMPGAVDVLAVSAVCWGGRSVGAISAAASHVVILPAAVDLIVLYLLPVCICRPSDRRGVCRSAPAVSPDCFRLHFAYCSGLIQHICTYFAFYGTFPAFCAVSGKKY